MYNIGPNILYRDEVQIEERPKAILLENTLGFEDIAGNSIRLCLEEQGCKYSP